MKLMLTLIFIVCSFSIFAQQSPFEKFGKVTPADLQRKFYAVDSSAPAVVVSDIGDTKIEGNTKGWFSSLTTRHKLVHILAKPGYRYADLEISLYSKDHNEEKLMDLKAVTYNLEGGAIVQTKLDKSAVFKVKQSENRQLIKFTMPNVKEGSMIEVMYSVSSDYYYQIDPWLFQYDIPTLWSEFNFSVPEFFTYTFISHGYQPFFIKSKQDHQEIFNVTQSNTAAQNERSNFGAGVTTYHWVQKDVPSLREEGYTSSLENHISKIEFQLASQSMPLSPRDFRSSWPMLTKELADADYFGHNLNSPNGWLADELKPILAAATTNLEKTKKLYAYVRDNFNCTSHRAYYTESPLKTIFKARKGNVAEINLLLTAMLRYAHINAEPVLLSRAPYGYSYELYPALSRFNYTVIRVMDGDNVFYLDASQPHLGFGHMLPDCYNGHARVVNEEATPVYFMADSLKERKVSALFLSRDDKAMWTGNMTQNPGYMESYKLRGQIEEKGVDQFFKTLQKDLGGEVKISGGVVDSLRNYDQSIALKYNLTYDPEKADILYVNPMFGEGYKKNPFTAAERFYPVEMPYASDETFVLNMQVPEGYVVDELPKQMLAKLDEEGNSFFEYRIQSSGDMVSLRSRIKLNRAFYSPDEYESLRSFFSLIVKKHGEQVVFKKKN